jgi:DNA repair exonuclease SbcCD nuclease subunit
VFPSVKERKIKKIIQLGDFFDNRNSVSLHDIDYVLREFLPQLEETGAHMYVLAGNHDVAFKNTNRVHSLSILETSPSVTIVHDHVESIRTESKTFVLCPWINNENEEQLMEDLKAYATKNHILCGHFEFEGMRMNKTSKPCEHGLNPKDFKKYDRVISGHFHHPSTYGNVSYMGSVFHLTWQDHDDSKFIYIYDTNTDEFEPIENPYSLYTQIDYHECNMTDDELSDECRGKFVRIIIDQEYKRVELKDLIHRIEKVKPLSVDVIDNTILDVQVNDTSEVELSDSKDIKDYVDEFLKDSESKSTLVSMFDEIYTEAQQRMKEIE